MPYQPTQTLFFTSTLCERKAANIRNETEKAINQNNTSHVIYRYLQSKKGVQACNLEKFAATYAVRGYFLYLAATLFFYGFDGTFNELHLACSIFALRFIVHSLPNTENLHSYKENKKICKYYLINTLEKTNFDTIKKFPFSTEGLTNLSIFLKNKHQDTSFLEEKLQLRGVNS